MKTKSNVSKLINPAATEAEGKCTLPNCPVCGDPVAPDGTRPASDAQAQHAETGGINLNQPHAKALNEWMSRLQFVASLHRALTLIRWALEGFLRGVLVKPQWTNRPALEAEGYRLFLGGLELWTYGRYKPPVIFTQLLNQRMKPTGKYYLGPQVGDGLVIDFGRKKTDLADQGTIGLLNVAYTLILKDVDTAIAAKIDGALNTNEQLNSFLQFCQRTLVSDDKTPEDDLAHFNWTVARSFGNEEYRVKEIRSRLTNSAVPVCFLSLEKYQVGVLLRCDYRTAMASYTDARKKVTDETSLFHSEWIKKLFDPQLNEKLYAELDRINEEQENRTRSEHIQAAHGETAPNSGSSAGTPLDPHSLSPAVLRIEHLKKQVDEVLAQHPAIDSYIRGQNPSGPVTAESVAACYLVEAVTHTSWPGRIECTTTELEGCEKKVRERFGMATQNKMAGVVLDTFCEANVGTAPADGLSAIVRLLAVEACLARYDRSHEFMTADGKYKPADKSALELVVKGRPDLTQLKKHLLEKGGKRFQRNDYLGLQIDPTAAARLVAEGAFRAGTNLLFNEMEPSNCHGNALDLASYEGVELWRGFGLSEGMWAFHSWCVLNDRILETTSDREIYFGVHVPVPFHKLLVSAAAYIMVSEHDKANAQ